MRVHYIKLEPKTPISAATRVSVGGSPIMAQGQEWPACRLCKTPMIFFFQFDIGKEADLPLKPGSHVLVFMCPIHNDIPSPLIDPGEKDLPAEYWNQDFGHYRLIMNKSPKNEVKLQKESYLKAVSLKFTGDEEPVEWDGRKERGSDGFKLGGVPLWQDEPEFPRCSCGADMVFFCQIPPRFGFPKAPQAPVQPDAISADTYTLFMGRATYLFACKDQCTPFSLYAVSQERPDLDPSVQTA
jgi:hypothetical protein